MAILVRASFQMREFEDRFVTLGLPYRVIGGPRFYERLEIRDALAYLRVVASRPTTSPSSASSMCRSAALGEPRSLQVLHDHARALGVPMLEAAAQARRERRTEAEGRAQRCARFVANFARWQERLETTPHTELAEIILDESGYTEMWKNDRSPKRRAGWKT
jgi:DNA helicase-2/ATP-dependent DNA helicase PcrA